MKITKDLLKKINACDEGINFLTRNNLSGFPLDRINEIEGDYDSFITFISNISITSIDDHLIEYKTKRHIIERWFDESGKVLLERYSDIDFGNVLEVKEYKYDSNNNNTLITVYRNKNNNAIFKKIYMEYDDNNNLIHHLDTVSQYEFWKKYDENGDNIYFYDNSGEEYTCTYDNNHNVIKWTGSREYTVNYEYDDNHNIIHHVDSTGYEEYIDYDYYGNIFHKTVKLSSSHQPITNYYNTKYYPDGQLMKYGSLLIPYFDK